MFSQTTFQDVIDELGWLCSDDVDELKKAINAACRRIIQSGSWNGCIVEVVFDGSTGYITLPSHLASITAVTTNKCPAVTFSRDYQYVEMGPGTIQADVPGYGLLVDAGDQWVTSINHTAGQQLRFVLSSSEDADVEFRYFGEIDGQVIFDPATGATGYPGTFTYPNTTSTLSPDKFTGFQKPTTKGTVSVYSWDGVTATLLQVYQPYERNPRYKRYLTGTYDTDKPIAALCRRRYTPIVSPTDFVIPDDMNALRCGIKAIQSENASNYDEANQSWAQAFQILNEAHKNSRGKSIPSVVIHGPGGYPSWQQYVR